MNAPGVTVRPLVDIAGGRHFNEVFLQDVRLGDDMVLGVVNAGWGVSQGTLGGERSGYMGGSGGGRRHRQVDAGRPSARRVDRPGDAPAHRPGDHRRADPGVGARPVRRRHVGRWTPGRRLDDEGARGDVGSSRSPSWWRICRDRSASPGSATTGTATSSATTSTRAARRRLPGARTRSSATSSANGCSASLVSRSERPGEVSCPVRHATARNRAADRVRHLRLPSGPPSPRRRRHG